MRVGASRWGWAQHSCGLAAACKMNTAVQSLDFVAMPKLTRCLEVEHALKTAQQPRHTHKAHRQLHRKQPSILEQTLACVCCCIVENVLTPEPTAASFNKTFKLTEARLTGEGCVANRLLLTAVHLTKAVFESCTQEGKLTGRLEQPVGPWQLEPFPALSAVPAPAASPCLCHPPPLAPWA